MIYILAAILIFGVLIAVHEWGHFIAARLCGVTVHEFSIGMGPALVQRERPGREPGEPGEPGTRYTLRLLPIGGYCLLEGEEEESDNPRALNNQGFWKKVFIFAAGAAMNFLVGFLMILCLYASAAGFRTAEITGFYPDCPYQGAEGLQTGDVIRRVDGHAIWLFSDLDVYLSRSNGRTVDLVVERAGRQVELPDFPFAVREYTQENGETFRGYGLYFAGVEKATWAVKLRVSWYNALDMVRLIWMGLGDLFTGAAGVQDMSGPVGIVSAISEVGEQSKSVRDAVENIVYFGALIAVNLAVMNLLPIPAVDGGKIFFLVINALAMLLFKRQIPPKYENFIHAAGFVLLMGLMLVVTFQDIWKLAR